MDLFYLLIHKGQCLYVWVGVCAFSKEIKTAGQIWMKFGTEVVLKGEGSWGVSTWYPPHPGYGVHKGGPGGLYSLSHAFWCNL